MNCWVPSPLLGEQTTASLLQDAVAAFGSNRVPAISAIRRLQTSDPAGLALAAVHLLVSAEEKSPGLEYAAGLLTAGRLIGRPAPEQAAFCRWRQPQSLARKITWVEPFLDVHLVRQSVDDGRW